MINQGILIVWVFMGRMKAAGFTIALLQSSSVALTMAERTIAVRTQGDDRANCCRPKEGGSRSFISAGTPAIQHQSV